METEAVNGRSVRREAHPTRTPTAAVPRGVLSEYRGPRDLWLGDILLSLLAKKTLFLSLQVSKKYSEIEDFYQKLSSHYPLASLPPLPRKVLFVGEADIRERRSMFSEILRCVSKDAELAGSPELLEFLGA